MAKKYVTREILEKIYEANNALHGTDEYNKYHMENYVKYEKNGRWTNWKFVGWGIPYNTQGKFYIKTVGDNTYLITEYVMFGVRTADRYTINEAVKALIGLE